MNPYEPVDESLIYRLINHGPVLWIATRSASKEPDIAPIAWNCPVRKNPARILIAVGSKHRTFRNLRETGRFAACVPHRSQAEPVRRTGGVSGETQNKFETMGIESFLSQRLDVPIPKGVIAFMECRVDRYFEAGAVMLVTADCLHAEADPRAFRERMLAERNEGKTLHHLGGGIFCSPSDAPDFPED
jgi:flavin reductase (DIM6/NTAB) family NADH-FMN oxidoreductase RutF